MKRKHESDEEIDKEVSFGDADEFRDQMLDQELSNRSRNGDAGMDEDFESVIKPRGKVPNLALPLDWIGVYHKSGGIIYLHRKSRVCTWARPYHIGQASVRKHDVPTVVIPCLHQILALKHNKMARPDGTIGHHVGNLENHCGDHGDHLGNQGNDVENSTRITDDQHHVSAVGMGDHANTDGNQDNIDGNHHGNHENDNDYHGNSDDCNDGNNGNHANTDGDHGNDGNPGNPDGGHSNTDSSNVLNNDNIDTTNRDIPTQNIAQDESLSRMDFDTEAVTRNKTISSIKATEDGESDSNSDSSSKPTCPLEMFTVEEFTAYLKKLWEFHKISKKEASKLVLADSNEPSRDPSQEYKSAEILKTIPYLVQGTIPNSKNNEKVVINPAGKSARSLLHEYCLKVLKVKAEYTTKESGVPKTPFQATVHVDGLGYGTGMAGNKKQAKHLAAQSTLEILLPDFRKLMNVEEHLKIFDTIEIENPAVYELTTKLGLLSPYQVLNECIKRNQGVLTSELKFELNHGTDKKLYYTMECGKHKASGTCRNKKIGRELAAQALLQKLHPHLESWGSVLRIYVDEHTTQEFTKPEAPAPVTSSTVNKELLSDLKKEMWNLKKRKQSTPSTGFISKSFTEIDIQ